MESSFLLRLDFEFQRSRGELAQNRVEFGPPRLQLQLRICMNLIRLHTHESCPDLYRGSALAGMEVEGFNIHHWPDREVLQ